MKNVLLLLFVFPILASAQILEKQFVATVQYSGFTQINDSLFRGDLVEFRDILVEGYKPSNVASGFICLDGVGRAYRVKVINSYTYSKLNVDLIEYQDNDLIPVGVGVIAERFSSTYEIPNAIVNSIGISSVLHGKILNHNAYISSTKYLLKSDTAAMLDPYISTAGWGLLKSAAHTLRADSTLLATKLYARNLPTYITSGQVAYSNGSNLVGSPNFLFDGRVRAPYGYSAAAYGFVGDNNKFIRGDPDGISFIVDAGREFIFNSSAGTVRPNNTNMQLGRFNAWWESFYLGRSYARTASGSSSSPHYSFQDGSGNIVAAGMYATGTFANNNLGFSTKATAEATATAKLWINADGKLGIGTNFTTPSYILDINSTDALRLPRGTTAQRPTGALSILRGNTDNTSIEWYNGTRWATALESTFARGTSGRPLFSDSNGQATDDSGWNWDSTNDFMGIGGSPAARLHLIGNISAPSWTTNGIAIRLANATYTNTTSSGTVALQHSNSIGNPTFASSSATTITDAINMAVGTPVAGTNTTLTRAWSILAEKQWINSRLFTSNGFPFQIFAAGAAATYYTTTPYYSYARGGSNSAIVAQGQITSNGASGHGIIGNSISDNGLTSATITGIRGEVYPDRTNTGGSVAIAVRATGRTSATQGSFHGVYSDPEIYYAGGGGLTGNTVNAFTGQFPSRNNAGATTVRGYYFAGISAPGGGTNRTITTYNPLAIVQGNLTEITDTWSYIDHNTTIGAATQSARTLHVAGTARITGSSGTATAVMGRDANGDISNLSISSDLKLASGILGLKRKSLIDSLPIASVSIDGNDNALSFNFLNSFTVDFETTAGSITSDGDITTIESDSEVHLITGQDARLDLTDEAKLSVPNLEGGNVYTVGFEGFYSTFTNTLGDPDSAFTIITDGDRGLIKMHEYGNGYVDATYTGEYPGKYILATTANHNVMDYRIDRDTLVVDANLSVGTLLYYTQNLHINLRMTALAGTNSTITFPDAAEVFRGKSIYVRVLEKDPGIYVPVINVAGGGSRLLYTSTTTTAPADQANLTMDNVTWPFFRTYKFTCLNTGTTPDYRWVLNQ